MDDSFWAKIFEHDLDGENFDEIYNNPHMQNAIEMIKRMEKVKSSKVNYKQEMNTIYKQFRKELNNFDNQFGEQIDLEDLHFVV